MSTTYKSNSNIRRIIEVRLTEPQYDALLTIIAVGEDRAQEAHIPERTRQTAERAVDAIVAGWQGSAA